MNSLGTSRGAVVLQRVTRDGLAVDLVGPVVDARGARPAVHRLERHVGGVAQRAVGLDGAVDHVVQHRRAVVLDHRDLVARGRRADLVHLPRRVQRHEPRGVHLGARVGDPVLDGLLLREQRAVGEATTARSHIMSKARWDWPSQRMQ